MVHWGGQDVWEFWSRLVYILSSRPASIVMVVTLLTHPGEHQLFLFLSNSPDLTTGNFDPKDHRDPGNFTECGANGTGFPLEPFLSEKLPSLS